MLISKGILHFKDCKNKGTYILIKGSIHKEDTLTRSIYIPNNRTSKRGRPKTNKTEGPDSSQTASDLNHPLPMRLNHTHRVKAIEKLQPHCNQRALLCVL